MTKKKKSRINKGILIKVERESDELYYTITIAAGESLPEEMQRNGRLVPPGEGRWFRLFPANVRG